AEIQCFFKAGFRRGPAPREPEALDQIIETGAFFEPCASATHHGLPTIAFRQFSNAGTFLISGKGIRQGEELSRPVHLKDVTPTICHLLGVAPPKHSEGRILWETLE
ncbi:MAG: hypothetical protein KAU31_10085, partial [Spirochaetaceae bacterium]|nr:hypothetical protein [Spirochaetaceae bacterium]